jgi:hypothetical protein
MSELLDKNFDFIVKSDAPQVKYANCYKLFDDHAEIHIINAKENIDKCTIIIDKDSVNKCRQYIWRTAAVQNKKYCVEIRTTINYHTVSLSRYLANVNESSKKVFFEDSNFLNFKLNNLLVHNCGKSIEIKYSKRANLKTKMRIIYEYGYFIVTYYEKEKAKYKIFSFNSFDSTIENLALQKAITFRNNCTSTPISKRKSNTGYNRISKQEFYRVQGYINHRVTKTFSVIKYGSKEKALEAAIAYRDSLFEKEN